MLKKRLIPVLLLKNGFLVRSEVFKTHQIIGNPIIEVERFNEWNVDELIYLDITRQGQYDLRRNDHRVKSIDSPLAILDAVSKTCFMPLTWGGRIRTLEDMRECFNRGADKVTINTMALNDPGFIKKASNHFGSQAIVVSIDVFQYANGHYEVFGACGQMPSGRDPLKWAREVEEQGAGEILLQCVNRDGMGNGYELDLINRISSRVSIPVIACSGVGIFEHYAEGIEAGASAVAAANIWHFKELADRRGKKAMAAAGIDVRIK